MLTSLHYEHALGLMAAYSSKFMQFHDAVSLFELSLLNEAISLYW
jgi:hypothetical protein